MTGFVGVARFDPRCDHCGGPVEAVRGPDERLFTRSLAFKLDDENDDLRQRLRGAERRINELKAQLPPERAEG